MAAFALGFARMLTAVPAMAQGAVAPRTAPLAAPRQALMQPWPRLAFGFLLLLLSQLTPPTGFLDVTILLDGLPRESPRVEREATNLKTRLPRCSATDLSASLSLHDPCATANMMHAFAHMPAVKLEQLKAENKTMLGLRINSCSDNTTYHKNSEDTVAYVFANETKENGAVPMRDLEVSDIVQVVQCNYNHKLRCFILTIPDTLENMGLQ